MGKGRTSKKYSVRKKRDKKYIPRQQDEAKGPTLLMPGESQLTVMKDMYNGGRIKQDAEAKIIVGGNYTNVGEHEIRDYSEDKLYKLLENAIKEVEDKELRAILEETRTQSMVGNKQKTKNLIQKILQWSQNNRSFIASNAFQALITYLMSLHH